jgi:hypothetical protein
LRLTDRHFSWTAASESFSPLPLGEGPGVGW